MPENLPGGDKATEVTDDTTKETVSVDDKPEGTEPKVYDENYVTKLRNENASRRVREKELADTLESLQAKVKEFEDAQLSDQERLTKELQELRESSSANLTRAQSREVDFQLALAAADPTNGIGDVKAAIKLIDRDTLEFDNKGNVLNLQDALETLKQEYPSVGLVSNKPSAPNPGPTNPSKATGTTKWTRAQLAKMTPEKVVELQEAGELNHLLRGSR